MGYGLVIGRRCIKKIKQQYLQSTGFHCSKLFQVFKIPPPQKNNRSNACTLSKWIISIAVVQVSREQHCQPSKPGFCQSKAWGEGGEHPLEGYFGLPVYSCSLFLPPREDSSEPGPTATIIQLASMQLHNSYRCSSQWLWFDAMQLTWMIAWLGPN